MELPVTDINLDRGKAGLGFHIQGGTDTPYLKGESGIYISKIKDSGAAFRDGRLKAGDKILEVNGVNVEHVTHIEAVAQFVKSGNSVKLKVQQGAKDEYLNQVERNRMNSKQLESSDDMNISLKVPILAVVAIGSLTLISYLIYKRVR